MSVAGSSSFESAASESRPQVSSKSWPLTFNSESRDVLVWKNGARLKLKDGLTAGRVRSIAVSNDTKGIVTVSMIVCFVCVCITYYCQLFFCGLAK